MLEEQNTHKLHTNDEITTRLPEIDGTDRPTLRLPHHARQEVGDVALQATVKRPQVLIADLPSSGVTEMPTQPFVSPKTKTPSRTIWRGYSTVIALVLFIIVNLVVQVYRRPLDVAGDVYYGLRRVQQCESLGRVPDVLYIGSSRTIFSANAHLIDDTVQAQFGKAILSCNVGAFSSTIAEDYYTLKRMIEDGYAPKIAVETLWEYNINVNAVGSIPSQNISAADIAGMNTAQIMNLADASDAPDLTLQFAHMADKSTTAEFLANKLIPLYGTRIGLLSLMCGSATFGPCGVTPPGLDPQSIGRYKISDDLGWIGVPNSSLATQSRTLYNDHYNHYLSIATGIANFRIGGHQIDYLAKMVTLAKAHHVQLVLVAAPVHPFLFDYLTHPSDWQMIMDYWQAFANQNGVPFYDQSTAPGYTDADFLDPQHLDPAGSVKYGTWLAENVIGPLLSTP